MDGGELFAGFLLIAGYLVGAFAATLSVFLLLRKVWRSVRHTRAQDWELREEQRRAVAIAEAHVRQHYYDRIPDSDTGPMPAV